jgi:hypothetical protein
MKKLFLIATIFWLEIMPKVCLAQIPDNGGLDTLQGNVKLGSDINIIDTIARIINFVLGFLGIIALVIILIAGFQWMTAAGNEEKITTAKKMLGAAVIGLVIILASFAIANFVVANLSKNLNATI